MDARKPLMVYLHCPSQFTFDLADHPCDIVVFFISISIFHLYFFIFLNLLVNIFIILLLML